MNRLARETSPYLLQHAANPVDWYPWGEEALERARREGRPILLSIGYSACHWCHVMAHESFEDPATAAVMNRLFVNVKVDREERPDLDKIYQTAHHFMAQRPGGWPLTMFLTAGEQVPFFGGTYFPNTPTHGLPAFTELLERVADYYRSNGADIQAQGKALREAFHVLDPADGGPADLDAAPLQAFREMTASRFDREFGGFGGAPKFPHPTTLERLLRHWRGTAQQPEPDRDALFMVALTLTGMAEGGIYDQLGGGFCRYAVDRHWTIPHFEKMLYDNGPLLALYAWMFQISGEESYRNVARDTADWLLRDMRSPEGAFWSSLDADSEGVEGRFYVWTPQEVEAAVEPEEYPVLRLHYGLDGEPNFHEPHTGLRAWHLRVHRRIEDVAKDTQLPPSTVRRLLVSGRARLLAVRNQRVWPGRDDKVLTSWNALAIRGLAIAGRALGRADLVAAAADATDFLRRNMVTETRLLATWRGGEARLNGYLDDYAFLLDAIIELLQARWNSDHLAFATWLADRLLDGFQDEERGGFWFTSHDHETLLHRHRPMADEAMPAGNGIAALTLGRLGHLLGEPRYLEAAERTLQAGWPAMQEYPHGHASLLNALEEWLQPPQVIVIRGGEEAARWAATAAAAWNPARLVFSIPADAPDLPPVLATRAPREGTVAYVCQGMTCGPPVLALEDLAGQLIGLT